ncbi:MAG: SOS response-associated peptidase [Gammaproteobacteria bacterium]
MNSKTQNTEYLTMCGRFTLGKQTDEIIDYFESHFNYSIGANTIDKFAFKFNIPPGTDILSLHYNNENQLQCHPIRWGLVPSWSKGIDNRFSMNNARSDTITSKPAFRTPFKQQRCLIITDGFYEWHNEANAKQPYYISRKDQSLFTFAGVWDQWISPDQSNSIQSCSIITTEASAFMTKIHSRMPVIISREHQLDWLAPRQSSAHLELMESLLAQSDYSVMHSYAVSKTVNSPKNDSPELVNKIKISN